MSSKNRFAIFKNDPRFRKLHQLKNSTRKARKIKIDQRFSNALTNPEFKALSGPASKIRGPKFSGKPLEFVIDDESNETSQKLCESETNESESDQSFETGSESESELSDDGLYDPARGIGNSESESESSDAVDYGDEYHGEKSIGGLLHNWNFNSENIETTNENSSTLALCNFDAATIRAQDLFTLFQSFVPLGGQILDVKIFLSKYGREKIAQEQTEGPVELKRDNNNYKDENEQVEMESIRLYQAQKLRYHYAIIRCSDEETANHLYTSCDGMEFETSALFVDLRYVPKSEMFDEESVIDSFKSGDTVQKYIPNIFLNKSLSHQKAQLTWDETDPRRVEVFQKQIKTDEDLDDFNAYLASSSSDDEMDENSSNKRSEILAEKRRAILLGLETSQTQDNEGVKKQSDGGNKSTTIQLDPEEMKPLTPEASDAESDESSDDDNHQNRLSKQKNFKGVRGESKHEKDECVQPTDLELLLAEADDSEFKHFDYKKIVKNDNLSNKSKKQKLDDDFHVDTGDLRFRAVFERADFALDPSDPKFKPSRAMKEILEKRANIREKLEEDERGREESNYRIAETSDETKELTLRNLVQSIKTKSANRKSKIK